MAAAKVQHPKQNMAFLSKDGRMQRKEMRCPSVSHAATPQAKAAVFGRTAAEVQGKTMSWRRKAAEEQGKALP